MKNLDNIPQRPIYQQLRNHLASAIARGEYPPGATLQGIGELGRQHQVSPATVAHALKLLAAEGLVRCSKGRAARVLPPVARRGHWRIAVTVGNIDQSYSEFPYLGGSTIWTMQHLALRRLLNDRNPALNLSGQDWKQHVHDIDGVLLLRPDDYHDGSLEWLAAGNRPWVVLETFLKETDFTNTVSLDFAVGAAQAATSFLSRGIRRIFTALAPGVLTAPPDNRFDPFFQTLYEQNFPASEIIQWPNLSLRTGQADPERIAQIVIPALRSAPRPIGILSCCDFQCLGLLEAARQTGLTLKQDIFIIGASGLPESAIRHPALSVLEPPFEKLVNCGVDMLYRLLETHTLFAESIRMPVKLVVRDT